MKNFTLQLSPVDELEVMKKHARELEQCEDVDLLDKEMDKIGITSKKEVRMILLLRYMGVQEVFGSSDIDSDIQYRFAKESFIDKNWMSLKG
jgi:hypothetical protein